MPIDVKCQCGKQMRVADKYLGKRMKCPECNNPVLIEPAKTAKKPAAASPPGGSSAAPKLIAFSCSCGRKMQVKPEYAGRGVKCPGCGKGVRVPGGAPATKPPAPPVQKQAAEEEDDSSFKKGMDGLLARSGGRKQAPPDEDEDQYDDDTPSQTREEDEEQQEDEDEDDRPKKGKKGKKKGGSMLPVLLGVLLVLALGGGAAWYFLFNDTTPAKPTIPIPPPPGGPGPIAGPGPGPGPGPMAGGLPLVPANAGAFATVRVADLISTDLGRELMPLLPAQAAAGLKQTETVLGLTLSDLERVTVVMPSAESIGALAMGGPGGPNQPPEVFVVFTTSKPVESAKVLGMVGLQAPPMMHNGKEYHAQADKSLYFHSENVVVAGTPQGVRKAIDLAVTPVTDGPLAAVLAQVDKQHLFACAPVPPQVAQMRPQVPKEFEPYAPLMDAKLVQIVGDVQGTTVNLSLSGDFGDDARAMAGKQALDTGKVVAGTLMAAVKDIPPQLTEAFNKLTTKQEGPLASVNASIPVDPKVVREALSKVNQASTRVISQNNLKQIGLAFHNHEGAMGKFPGVIRDPQGKVLHSWRVAILPYIEQEALYRKIKLDEPWDSEHNKQFHAMMPKIFEMPGLPPQAGMTHYQGFNGKGSILDQTNAMGVRVSQVTDGLSNTLLVIESATPVNWMEPKDIDFMPGPNGFAPTGKVGTHFPGGFNALFGDGSVRFLPLTITAQNFLGAITMAGGEEIDLP